MVCTHDVGCCEKAEECDVSELRQISGDGKMPVLRRVEYLWRNAVRNLGYFRNQLTPEFFYANFADAKNVSSPGRLLAELHLRQFLSASLPVGKINVLDIGCGSGRLCRILSDMGYSGKYIGLDIYDRFSIDSVPRFERKLVLGDAHQFKTEDLTFNLIISMSALEHIPKEQLLLDRLPALLSTNGIELHYVPSGWGLPIYLWHGFRQYPLGYVSEAFGFRGLRVIALGGLFSFMLHFVVITIGELLLRIPVRKKLPRFYKGLLRLALRFDCYAKQCPSMFAVIRTQERHPSVQTP